MLMPMADCKLCGRDEEKRLVSCGGLIKNRVI
jgi:hypothetical protein